MQHRYELCFRIGCASWSFEFKNTSIDFELLAPENRMMTQGRINTNCLHSEKINEVIFLMNRLTPLTQSSLEKISFKHNGVQNSKIYFYGIHITELENRSRHYFPVNVYIRSFWQKVLLIPSTEPIGPFQLHVIGKFIIQFCFFFFFFMNRNSIAQLGKSCGKSLRKNEIRFIAVAE